MGEVAEEERKTRGRKEQSAEKEIKSAIINGGVQDE